MTQVTHHVWYAARIIPASRGGKDIAGNLRVSCGNCNTGRDSMGVYNTYEWMIETNKPGVKFLDMNDPNVILAIMFLEMKNTLRKFSQDHEIDTAPINEREDKYMESLSKLLSTKRTKIRGFLK